MAEELVVGEVDMSVLVVGSLVVGWLVVAFRSEPDVELVLELEVVVPAVPESAAGVTVRVRCPEVSAVRTVTRVPTLTFWSIVAPWFVSSNERLCPSSVRTTSVFPGSYWVTVPVTCSEVEADALCDPVVLWS